MTTIAEQRRAALAARRALSYRERGIASRLACRRLVRLPAVRRAQRIGLYRALASEIDPEPIALDLGPRVSFCFPRVEGDLLRFVAPRSPTNRRMWQTSALGVAEPRGRSRAVASLDVLILPLAGFDDRAHRIGLGGGFYDRTLAAVRDARYRAPTLIGLAFDAQRLDMITPAAWDVPLAAVVTERRIYRAAKPEGVRIS